MVRPSKDILLKCTYLSKTNLKKITPKITNLGEESYVYHQVYNAYITSM